MYILTCNNMVADWGEKVEAGRWENDETRDTYRVTRDGEYSYTVIEGFTPYEVDTLPEDIEQNKYCYTSEQGFYLNESSQLEPEPAAPTVEEQLAELQSQVKTLEAKNTALTTSNQFLEDCIAEMAETVYQ